MPDPRDIPVHWPRPSRLEQALEVPGGPKAAAAAEALGLHTVRDLLFHLPRDTGEARTVATLAEDETATVLVEVRSIRSRPVRRRGMKPLVVATVADATGVMEATFFNQPWLERHYRPGTRLMLDRQVPVARALPRQPPRADGGRHRDRRDDRDVRRDEGDHLDADPRARPRAPRGRPRHPRAAARAAAAARGTAGRRRCDRPPRTSATARRAGAGSRSTSCSWTRPSSCACGRSGGRSRTRSR